MDDRDKALIEIKDRITLKKDDLLLTSFKQTPDAPLSERDLTCVVMHEGDDYIIKYSPRTNHGYPATRQMEVVLEIVTKSSVDIKKLYRDLRRVVFSEKGTDPQVFNPRLVPGNKTTFIRENHSEGPTGYGLPGIIGVRLVLDLIYVDGGL